MSTTPNSTSLLIRGPSGEIELLVDEPVAMTLAQALVVCHPHPLFGGTLLNKVAHILARAGNDLGVPAVRFNFRGVGKSTGTHDDGRGEAEDVLAVLEWTAARYSKAQLWLAGFSFGGAMALRAALRYPVQRLITVAPALKWLNQADEVPSCPWLIVQGAQDELVDAYAVQSWAQGLQRPPQIELLAGADHFFHGRLIEVREAVKAWLTANSGAQ